MKNFKMPSRKTKDERAPPVLMRIFPHGPQGDSFRDEELPQLPAYARAKATHPRAVDADVNEPPMKRARLAASASGDAVLDALSSLPAIDGAIPADTNLSSPPPSASSSSDSTHPPLEHIAPRPAKTLQHQFPSIFYFCFMWHLCSSVAVRRRETPATMSWDKLLEGFEIPGYPSLRLAHSSYNRILQDFRRGTPALWNRFLELGRDPAATISEYRKMLGPSAKPVTSLPWEPSSFLAISDCKSCHLLACCTVA